MRRVKNLRPTLKIHSLPERDLLAEVTSRLRGARDAGGRLGMELFLLAMERLVHGQPLSEEAFLPVPGDRRDWHRALDQLIQADVVAWMEEWVDEEDEAGGEA